MLLLYNCSSFLLVLQVAQNIFSSGEFKLWWFVNTQIFNYSIVDNHSIALASNAHTTCATVLRQANFLGKFRIAVTKHSDFAFSLKYVAPGVQYKCIIYRGTVNSVYTLCLNLWYKRNKGWAVRVAASWSESAFKKQNN